MKKVLLTLALAAFTFAANAQFVVTGNIGFNTNGGSVYGKMESTATGFTTIESKVPQNINNLFTFSPSVGYMLNDEMQVGLCFDLSISYRKTFSRGINNEAYTTPHLDAEAWTKVSQTNFTVAPYFRYYFMEAGNFNFFCQATVYWQINGRPHTHNFATKIDTDLPNGIIGNPGVDTSYVGTYINPLTYDQLNKHTETSMALGINIVPGVNYKFNDNFSADLYLDIVSVNFSHQWQKEYLDVTNTVAGVTITDKQTNRTRNNNFRFGADFDNLSINQILGFRLAFNYHF